jgi:predicted Zn-dependent protease
MSETLSSKGLRFVVMLLLPALIQACATRPVYRPPSPSRSPVPSNPPSPQGSLPPPRPPVSPPKPLPEEPKVKEEDLREKRPAPQERSKEQRVTPTPGGEPAPLPDDSSLIAKITPQTPPQRAASLRLTEEGRKILESGDYAKALSRLEKTISIDSTNPYGYYYLAKAHYHLGHYQESINFLDVAESFLGGQSYWLAEVLALKGENYRALGFSQKADSTYSEALRLNPGNRAASEGLSRMRGDIQPPTY